MHSLADGVYLDDVEMLRLRDVSRVWLRDDDEYYHRAIAGLGENVADFELPSEACAAGLIKAASGPSEIVAIHLEALQGEPLVIGRVTALRKKRFVFHFVGRHGTWVDELERWRYRDVTRISMGGRYLKALNRFADPYPEPSPV